MGRALSEEEKARPLEIAATNPDWQVARCAAILALNTTMRGREIKNLLWGDVNLVDRTLTIRQSKTETGERVIPLNSEAMKIVIELVRRAEAFDGANLNNYVFPACENGKIDPTKPQQTWHRAWRRLTRTIRCPACGQLQNPGETCRNKECKADIRKVISPVPDYASTPCAITQLPS